MTDARDERPADDPQTRSRMDRLRVEQARAVRGIARPASGSRPRDRTPACSTPRSVRSSATSPPEVACWPAQSHSGSSSSSCPTCSCSCACSVSVRAPPTPIRERSPRDAGIGGLAAKAMGSVGDLSTTERIVSLVVAGFALFLATRALLKVLRIVHALIWHTRAGKPEKPTRAAFAVVGIVTMALGLAMLVGKLRSESFLAGLVVTLLFVAVPFTLWLLVSWYMPRPADLPWAALLPGAVFFGVGIEGLHIVTVYWIAHEVESKTDTYGALGFALALLLWAYLLGRVVTSATVLNESLWSHYQERHRLHRDAREPGLTGLRYGRTSAPARTRPRTSSGTRSRPPRAAGATPKGAAPDSRVTGGWSSSRWSSWRWSSSRRDFFAGAFLRGGLLGGGLLGGGLLGGGLLRRCLLGRALAGEHRVLERLQGRDPRPPRRLDADRLTGLRVAAHARGTLDPGELGEAADHHDLSARDGFGDGVDERLEVGVGGALVGVVRSASAATSSLRFMGCSWSGFVGVFGGLPVRSRRGCSMPPGAVRSLHRPEQFVASGVGIRVRSLGACHDLSVCATNLAGRTNK